MKYRIITPIIALTYFLNFIWENAQAPLYEAYDGFSKNWLVCAKAALGDLVIVGTIFTLMTFLFGREWISNLSPKHFVVLFLIGGILAIIIEKWGLSTGRWQYNEMPTIPILNIGPTPVLQMLIIPPAIAYSWKIISRQ